MLKLLHNFRFCPKSNRAAKNIICKIFEIIFISNKNCVCARNVCVPCIAFIIHKIKSDGSERVHLFSIIFQIQFAFLILLLHSLHLYGFRGTLHRFIWAPNVYKTRTARDSTTMQCDAMRMCERDKRYIRFNTEMKLQNRQPHNSPSTSAKLIHRVTWMRRFIAIYTVVSCPFLWFDA